MSDEKKYTEREMVMRERAAFRAGGVRWAGDRNAYVSDIAAEAVRRFPLALITRPRVVTDKDGSEWRVAGSRVECRVGPNEPFRASIAERDLAMQIRVDEKFRREFASLLLEPNETVPDEDISNV